MSDANELLKKLESGELKVSDIDPGIKIACLTCEGENVTPEMIQNAKISRELFDQLIRDVESKYYLPYCTCHYKNGVLYPYIRKRNKDNG